MSDCASKIMVLYVMVLEHKFTEAQCRNNQKYNKNFRIRVEIKRSVVPVKFCFYFCFYYYSYFLNILLPKLPEKALF